MAGKILLEVVTPDKLLLSQDVDEVIVPGVEGEFGVLPGHCHFLSNLRIGELRYRSDGTTSYISILSGLAEVTPTRVTVLADVAEKAEEIDVERAEEAVQRALKRLETGGLPSEVREAQLSLEKARLRKKIAQRTKQKHMV